MTQKERIKKAIEILKDSIDIWPDKTTDICRDNEILDGVIDILEALIRYR
jgi:hypothetical protein